MPHASCSVCKHDQLEAIDKALLSGASLRATAKQFRLTHAALHRHRHHGAPGQSRKDIGSFERIDREIRKLRHAETAAKKRRDSTAALQIARELRHWFTLRVRAEAVDDAGKVEPPELSADEALALAKALIESRLDDPDVVVWLRWLLNRADVAFEPVFTAASGKCENGDTTGTLAISD